jgi:hypothetical protein
VSTIVGEWSNLNQLIKICVLLLSLMSTNAYCAENMSPANISKIETEVLEAFAGLVDASKALDPVRYFAYFDKEKFTGLNGEGKVLISIKPLESLIGSGFPMVEKSISLEFKNVKVTVIDSSTAILVNEYKQSALLKDGSLHHSAGGGVQVWHQSGGRWKLVSVSASDASK